MVIWGGADEVFVWGFRFLEIYQWNNPQNTFTLFIYLFEIGTKVDRKYQNTDKDTNTNSSFLQSRPMLIHLTINTINQSLKTRFRCHCMSLYDMTIKHIHAPWLVGNQVRFQVSLNLEIERDREGWTREIKFCYQARFLSPSCFAKGIIIALFIFTFYVRNLFSVIHGIISTDNMDVDKELEALLLLAKDPVHYITVVEVKLFRSFSLAYLQRIIKS